MKSLTVADLNRLSVFLRYLLDESGRWCCISTTNDYNTIVGRVEKEGFSFLTITLPNFGKELERALSKGLVESSDFPGFKKSRESVLPQFLGGMLALIFSSSDGVLLDEPSVLAIRCVRQISLVFAKVKLECSEKRTQAAMDKFVQCELDMRSNDARLYGPDLSQKLEQYQRIGRLLFARLYSEVDQMVYAGRYTDWSDDSDELYAEENAHRQLMPKHGPGSTADGLKGNQKYRQIEWTTRLEQYFPFGENAFSSWISFLAEIDSSRLVYREPWDERPVKVTPVPKTLKTPRIIAIEPTCMQYVQQGLLEAIVEKVARDDILAPFIDSTYQEPNQALAWLGSSDGSIATLDLSEASDRVSNQHVRLLLENHPHLMGAVDSCRSRKADVPGHGVLRLAKFASMGSALCFPFESMVFLTLVLCGIEDVLNTPLDRTSIKRLRGKVRVYGDDICVPTEYALSVKSSLEAFGFVVNASKSFWTGKFRESCGKEYFNGSDVSITRCREVLPTSRKDTAQIVSTVSLRNQLFLAGYDETVQYLDSIIEKVIPFPVVGRNSAILGKWSHSDSDIKVTHWDHDMQIPLIKGAVLSDKRRSNKIDGYPALMKHFLKRGGLPFTDREHLQYSGRPVSVNIKIRLASPN